MLQKIIKFTLSALSAFFVLLSLVLLYFSLFEKEQVEAFFDWIKIVITGFGNWNYLIVFISSLIESFPLLGVLVPGQNILLIVGGFFGSISKTTLIYVGILAGLGAIIGNYVGYFLGGKYGDDFFRKYGNWFGIGLTEVSYLKKSIHKWGAWGIIFGKFHPMTRSFLPFIAGSMGMQKKNFMIYNTIGSVLWSTTMVVLGMIFAEYYELIIKHVDKIMIVVFIGLAYYIYFFKRDAFMRYWRAKEAEMEELYGKK